MEPNLPRRKHTRLQGFDYSKTGYYFITICVKYRKQILSSVGRDDPGVPLTAFPTGIPKQIVGACCSQRSALSPSYTTPLASPFRGGGLCEAKVGEVFALSVTASPCQLPPPGEPSAFFRFLYIP